MQIRAELLQKVANHEFVVVLNGVTDQMLPGLNVTNVPVTWLLAEIGAVIDAVG